jgi:cobalamin synthase
MKFKKIQKKDYKKKTDYYNAFLSEHWWLILILFTLFTVIIALISFFQLREACAVIILSYMFFIITFCIQAQAVRKNGGGRFLGTPLDILILFSTIELIAFIYSFFT